MKSVRYSSRVKTGLGRPGETQGFLKELTKGKREKDLEQRAPVNSSEQRWI